MLVHPTTITEVGMTKEAHPEIGYEAEYEGYKANLKLPSEQFRIVGLEVTPRSVPYGKACTTDMYDHGYEVVWPDQQFQFSYNVRYAISDTLWPSRYDHYIKTSSDRLKWDGLLISFPMTFALTLVIGIILCSALKKDSAVLDYLRKSYR